MNNKFTKSRPQSITRRQAIQTFGLGVAGLALARFGINNAQAIGLGQLDGNAHPNVGGVVWLVSLWPDVPPPVVVGSGSLIHPRIYLTAGHLTEVVESRVAQGTLTLNDLRVSFAPNALDPGTWRSVSDVLTHPGYAPNGNSLEDVGVLILSEPVTGVAPAQLPPPGFLDALAASGTLKTKSDRTRFRVVGYGIDPDGASYGQLPFPPDGLRRFAEPEFQNLHDRWLYTRGRCFPWKRNQRSRLPR